MAIELRLDTANATLAEIEAFVAAARAAGASGADRVRRDGTQMVLDAAAVADKPREAPRRSAGESAPAGQPLNLNTERVAQVGDAAIRGLIEVLANRQEPGRR